MTEKNTARNWALKARIEKVLKLRVNENSKEITIINYKNSWNKTLERLVLQDQKTIKEYYGI